MGIKNDILVLKLILLDEFHPLTIFVSNAIEVIVSVFIATVLIVGINLVGAVCFKNPTCLFFFYCTYAERFQLLGMYLCMLALFHFLLGHYLPMQYAVINILAGLFIMTMGIFFSILPPPVFIGITGVLIIMFGGNIEESFKARMIMLGIGAFLLGGALMTYNLYEPCKPAADGIQDEIFYENYSTVYWVPCLAVYEYDAEDGYGRLLHTFESPTVQGPKKDATVAIKEYVQNENKKNPKRKYAFLRWSHVHVPSIVAAKAGDGDSLNDATKYPNKEKPDIILTKWEG